MTKPTLTLAPLLLATVLGACATPGGIDISAAVARCNADSINSVPGKAWWTTQRWRYADDAEATAAYTVMLTKQSPWPDWLPAKQDPPPLVELPVGTRFQMAMAPGQPETSPGSFGTFDDIRSVKDVRAYLAVRYEWKKAVDRVVTYEVTRALPARAGPIGPQVDPVLCRLLPGRWSQFGMVLEPGHKPMDYLRILSVRRLPQR